MNFLERKRLDKFVRLVKSVAKDKDAFTFDIQKYRFNNEMIAALMDTVSLCTIPMQMTPTEYEYVSFAKDWVAAWNEHCKFMHSAFQLILRVNAAQHPGVDFKIIIRDSIQSQLQAMEELRLLLQERESITLEKFQVTYSDIVRR